MLILTKTFIGSTSSTRRTTTRLLIFSLNKIRDYSLAQKRRSRMQNPAKRKEDLKRKTNQEVMMTKATPTRKRRSPQKIGKANQNRANKTDQNQANQKGRPLKRRRKQQKKHLNWCIQGIRRNNKLSFRLSTRSCWRRVQISWKGCWQRMDKPKLEPRRNWQRGVQMGSCLGRFQCALTAEEGSYVSTDTT